MAHAFSGAKAAASLPPLPADSSALSAAFNPQNVTRQAWGGAAKNAASGGSYAQAARQSPMRGALLAQGESQLEKKGSTGVVGSQTTRLGGQRPPSMTYAPAMQSRLGARTGADIRFGSFVSACGAERAFLGNGLAAACMSGQSGAAQNKGLAKGAPGASRKHSASGRSMVTCKAVHRGFGKPANGVGGAITPRRQRGAAHGSPLKVAALQSRNPSSKPLNLEDVSAFPKLTPPPVLRRAVAVRAVKGKKGGAGKGEEESGPLKRGVMVEFEREGGGGNKVYHVGVLQRPDGKKNWMVTDQLGNNHSIRPQQITFLVPPKKNQDPYSAADIQPLIEQADQTAADSDLLELAWESLIAEPGTSLDAHGMAELLFTGTSSVECLSAHRLLSADRTFFKPTKRKSADDLWVLHYEPRAATVVEDIKRQMRQEEERKALVSDFARFAVAAAGAPRGEKPAPLEWEQNESFAMRTAALRRFAMDDLEDDSDRRIASEVLDAMGCPKNPAVVFELLVKMGVLQAHSSLELMTGAIRSAFPDEVQAEADRRAETPPPDPLSDVRVDLRHLKVYMIDSDDTLEVDDGVSVERLPDGRKRLWVHVADPTRWTSPGDVLDYEARLRATSAYLPTGAVPMFPMALAGGGMSLLQGQECTAMSVGVVLRDDGSIGETTLVASRVAPTYRLSYEEVDELLNLGLDEEPELRTLLEEAHRRHEYRYEQHAIEIKMPDYDIRAFDLDAEPPRVTIKLINERAPSRRLVEEMMIMAGEAVALWGGEHGVALPYRGQEEPDLPSDHVLDQVPVGYCQSVIIRRCMTRSQINCRGPIQHSSLGLHAYVQFSSPIRRYADLLAHYQIKAVLRGGPPPFSADELSGMMSGVEAQMREVKRLTRLSERYWTLEFFRQQPKAATWRALLLKWLKEDDLVALILIYDLGLELPVRLQRSVRVGSDIQVRVLRVNVRQDVLELVETYQPQNGSSDPSSSGLPLGDAELAAAETSLSDALSDASFDEEVRNIVGGDEAGTSENGESHGSLEGDESAELAYGARNGHPRNGVSELENGLGAEERKSDRILVREAGS